MNPRNDSGVEIPGWQSQDCHNTPALILADGFEFLHLRFRGWRRLFLRLVSAEQASSLRLGGATEFLGEPERRQSRTPSCDSKEVGMRIYPAGQIGQDTQVRNTERQRVGSESAATLQSVSVDVVEAN